MLVSSLKMLKVSLNPLLSASPLLFFYYSPLSMVYFLLIREDITIFDCEFSHMGEQAIAVLDNSAFITYLSSLLISSSPSPSPSLTSYLLLTESTKITSGTPQEGASKQEPLLPPPPIKFLTSRSPTIVSFCRPSFLLFSFFFLLFLLSLPLPFLPLL